MNFIYNGKQHRISNHIEWLLMLQIEVIWKNGFEK